MAASAKNSNLIMYISSADYHSHQIAIAIYEKSVGVQLIDVDDQENDLAERNPYCEVPTLVDTRATDDGYPGVGLNVYPYSSIIEYIEGRYPHPSLLSIVPVRRARVYKMLYHIERDLYRQGKIIEAALAHVSGNNDVNLEVKEQYIDAQQSEEDVAAFLKEHYPEASQAREELCRVIPLIFEQHLFSMDLKAHDKDAGARSTETQFNIVDCSLLPLFWRLPRYGIRTEDLGGEGAAEGYEKLHMNFNEYCEAGFNRASFRDSLDEMSELKEIRLKRDEYMVDRTDLL